jgi:hypothetical protein
MEYGLTPNGFVTKTYEQILSEIEQEEKAVIDPELDVRPETVLGQLNAIDARNNALLWEMLRVCYSQLDPDNAEGIMLDNICKLTGIKRRPATYSLSNIDILFDSAGVQLIPDVFFVSTENGIRFTPVSIYTSTSDFVNPQTVLFRSENTGKLLIEQNAINTISTPVTGVVQIDASEAVTELNSGNGPETDRDLRNRRKISLSINGSSTVPAIESALYNISSQYGKIHYAKVYEALDVPTDFVEKRNSFKALIYDSASNVGEWDNIIAQTIWSNKPAGIMSLGSYDGYAYDDLGNSYIVNFERSVEKNLYITAHYYYTGIQPNSIEVKSAIQNFINTNYSVGDDVVAINAASIPFLLFNNIKDVDFDNYKIGTSPGPTNNDNIIIAFNEKPVINIDNINLAFSPFIDQ